MPNPKRRHSARRAQNRRAHDSLKTPGMSECPNCHEPKLPHRVCPHCGQYKGRQEVVRRELQQYDEYRGLPVEVVNASEQVTMEDSAARAVRAKHDSSLRVASRLVRDGIAQGFVSAGNTGAVMATAKIVQGVLPGVARPALAGIFPTLVGKPVVVIDVGANVDCSPRMLAQFAVMGETYSRVVLHQERPKVGLLSIGEEEHKGNEATRGATPLLKSLPIDFVGNVEGRDI